MTYFIYFIEHIVWNKKCKRHDIMNNGVIHSLTRIHLCIYIFVLFLFLVSVVFMCNSSILYNLILKTFPFLVLIFIRFGFYFLNITLCGIYSTLLFILN